MRIVSGKYGGRKLLTPKDDNIRPTSDKIRGAIFNILRGYGILENAHVLDLFCGTGALGLEALSQGAAHCIFVDKNRDSLNLAKENATALKATDECEFIFKDALKFKPLQPVNLVFLDPPYGKNLIPPALENLHETGMLNEGAILVAEEEKRCNLVIKTPFLQHDERIYGETKILILEYAP